MVATLVASLHFCIEFSKAFGLDWQRTSKRRRPIPAIYAPSPVRKAITDNITKVDDILRLSNGEIIVKRKKRKAKEEIERAFGDLPYVTPVV